MDGNKDGWKALERIRAKAKKEKEPSEAERLFFLFFPEASHWAPPSILLSFDPVTYVPYLKQTALAILGTGIIGENGLKGHAGHKKFFPVDQRDLIGALVDTHYKYSNVTFSPGDIIKYYDNLFKSVAAFVRLSGVKDSGPLGIKRVWNAWRQKVHLAVSQGNFPSNWRELTKVELISAWKYRPRSEALALAIVFLEFVPRARNYTIAVWVNTILKSLAEPSVSNSELREYIEKERGLRPYLSRPASKNSL
jgi:hypothetical protein